jgi:nitrite reductase/ring-hydroxylating ferredoxin subunit
MGLPLAQTLDAYLTPDGSAISCSWHAALFAIRDGRCLGGPCPGQALTPWPVTVQGEAIVTA